MAPCQQWEECGYWIERLAFIFVIVLQRVAQQINKATVDWVFSLHYLTVSRLLL